MKKILSCLLATLFLLPLAACGDSSTLTNSIASVPSTPEATATPSPTPTPTPEPTPEPINISFSETVSTDMVEFILDDCKFAEKVGLKSDNWLQPAFGTGGSAPGEGKIYLWFSFHVKNLSKEELSGYDVCNVKVYYNDGFIYDEAIYSGMSGFSTAAYISRNVGLPPIMPLGEQNFWGVVTCALDVREDRNAPLNVIFTLPSSEGKKEFIYPMNLNDNLTNENVYSAVLALNEVKDNLGFIIRNIDEVVGDNFDAGFIEGMTTTIASIDTTVLPETLTETVRLLPEIQERVQIVASALRPVEGYNVDNIKATCQEAIELIDSLLNSELSGV